AVSKPWASSSDAARGSMPLPACHPWAPALEAVTCSPSPASSSARRAMDSAMGERQMLPVHTNTTRTCLSPVTDDPLQLVRVDHGPPGVVPFLRSSVAPPHQGGVDAEAGGAVHVVLAVADHHDLRCASLVSGYGTAAEGLEGVCHHVGLRQAPHRQIRTADELERRGEVKMREDSPGGVLVLTGGHRHPVSVGGQAVEQRVHPCEHGVLLPAHLVIAFPV